MRSPSLLSLLASSGLLCVASVALAASTWSQFRSIQEPLPCSDGWVGCIVDGRPLDAGGVQDASGHPHPGTARVSFFDLKPLPAFDPFPSLSPYSKPPQGSTPVAVAPPPTPPVQQDPEPVAVNTTTAETPSSDPRIAPTRDPEPVAVNTTTPTSSSAPPDAIVGRTPLGSSTPPTTSTTSTPSSSPTTTTTPTATTSTSSTPTSSGTDLLPPSSRNPAGTTTTAATTTTPTATATSTPTTTTEQRDAVAMAPPETTRTTTPPPQTDDGSCDDLVALEAPAMMGTLGVARRKCLEARLASESSQTAKKKISLVLMQDAEQRQDQSDWERIIKRHLQDIDRSDPNLCFKYAIHLSRTGRHGSVIRWADYALENKQQWSGATYKKNVYALYKLRAQAANSLWQAAEQKFVEERSDTNEAEATKWRDTTKNYAREWLDYARASEQTTKAPLALCVSAAGSADFCEG